jgi:hypothetical protein
MRAQHLGSAPTAVAVFIRRRMTCGHMCLKHGRSCRLTFPKKAEQIQAALKDESFPVRVEVVPGLSDIL